MDVIGNAMDELQPIKPAAESEQVKIITITTQWTNADWIKLSIVDDGKGIQQYSIGHLA